MTKKTKRFSVLLAAIMSFGFVFSSCEEETETTESTKVDTVEKSLYTDGIHDYTAPETDGYIVQNGKTQYKLVLPESQDKFTSFAKDEFVNLFHQATEIYMPVLTETDDGFAHDKNAKYISIGNTKMLESAGLYADESVLGSQGVRIVTKDDTIYLFGGGEQGALYAVYDFMEIVFHYDVYYTDVWEIDENVKDVKMRDFNVTDVPDVEFRSPSFGMVRSNVNNLGYRFRQPYLYTGYMMPAGDTEHGAVAQTIHNSDNVLPSAYWRNQHPRWFADSGSQLCYTAHGDPEEYEMMIDQIASVYISNLKEYPVADYPQYSLMTLTMEDEASMCLCDACANAANLYGASSGAVIALCNRVMEKVQAEMTKPENAAYYREDLKLLFFAYHGFLAAPARWDNVAEKYVPTHPDLEMREDVGVFYALSKGMNFMASVYDDLNDSTRTMAQKWFDITGAGMYMWTYCTNFAGYMQMVDTYNHFDSEGYQFYVSGGAKMFYNQGNAQNKEGNNFNGLKAYLDAKLQWNCTLSEKELIEKWFNGMYGALAPTMYDLWLAEREYSVIAYDSKGRYASWGWSVNLYEQSVWPYYTLCGWLETCETALAQAEEIYAKYEPEKYAKIKRNIDVEWVSVAYLLFMLYGDAYIPKDKYQAMGEYFIETASNLGHMQPVEAGKTGILKEIQTILG